MSMNFAPTLPTKIVGYWLITGAIVVLAMIILGGYTRLSHSGLSIVSWKPITGIIPPLNEKEWQAEFEEYKATPEFEFVNYDFNIQDFKSIYWPEFYHRLLGRALGIIFLIPFFVFLRKGYFKSPKIIIHLVVIFFLGLLQGIVGWYMVKSGLVDNPSVSHIRLATHLFTALLLYAYLIWVAIPILFPDVVNLPKTPKVIKNYTYILFTILIIQIVFGALVAGLKAGLVFPTFPKMGAHFFPEIIGNEFERLGISALVNSPYVVQFVHRWIAAALVIGVFYLFFLMRKNNAHRSQKTIANALLIIVCCQFILGVLTLINMVPVSLGVLHQLFAVVLLSVFLFSFSHNRK